MRPPGARTRTDPLCIIETNICRSLQDKRLSHLERELRKEGDAPTPAGDFAGDRMRDGDGYDWGFRWNEDPRLTAAAGSIGSMYFGIVGGS